MNLDHIQNADLRTALKDLKEAITNITLGSIELAVIMEAGNALISNWNDHAESPEEHIDESLELNSWYHICTQ